VIALDAWNEFDPAACPACGRDSCEGCQHAATDGGDEATDASDVADFVRDPKGRICAGHLGNLRLALSRLSLRPTFNEFTREVELGGAPLDDVGLDRLWVTIADAFGFQAPKATLHTLISADAREASHHPVRQYLDGLSWDGTPRLDRWLIAYGRADDTRYVRAVGALPLVAAVRRVRRAGCKFDELLVLESSQGTLKSSALRALCPHDPWFTDDLPLGVDSKLVIERTAGKWIIEAAELHGNRGREAEALKAFLSRQTDGPVRLAYGRLPVTVPRQFVLIGTTNARLAYLKDGTGARRFWPVRVRQFDVEALARDRDQLWAEAAAREATGASIRLAPDLWHDAALAQEDRRAADPWEEILEPLLCGEGITPVDLVVVGAIWEALKVEANHRNNQHADRVAAIVQRYGFTAKQKRRVGGRPVLCWVRDPE
jgi:predicted P-loop ATPase